MSLMLSPVGIESSDARTPLVEGAGVACGEPEPDLPAGARCRDRPAVRGRGRLASPPAPDSRPGAPRDDRSLAAGDVTAAEKPAAPGHAPEPRAAPLHDLRFP